MVMVTDSEEDISIDEDRVATPFAVVPSVNAILTSLGAVALILIAAILTASAGILTLMVFGTKTSVLTIAPPEAVYEHTKELKLASGQGVMKEVLDTTTESFPLANVTP